MKLQHYCAVVAAPSFTLANITFGQDTVLTESYSIQHSLEYLSEEVSEMSNFAKCFTD